jgi:hypothetical protein
MADSIDFIRDSIRRLHSEYNHALSGLTAEQVHWRANDQGLPIAFVLWHYVRTEDNVINYVLQGRPTIWLERGLHETYGLHKAAQGTGMTLQEAQSIRLEPFDLFLDYVSAVWRATEDFLASKGEAYLDERTMVKPLGEMPVRTAVGQMCLTHGFTHLGEIAYLRGLLGLRGMAV